MRVNNRILIQSVEEAGVVILDEVTDQEVVIPPEHILTAVGALSYFSTPAGDQTTAMPTSTGYYVDTEGDMWRVEPDGSVFYTERWVKQDAVNADEDAAEYGPFRRLA